MRRLWGERCANINAGGLGFTSEEARQHAARLWADPDWADRQREVIRETRRKSWSDPSWSENQRQVIGAATATQWRENEEWAKWQRERLSRMADDPDWRAKNAAVNAVRREKAKTPEAIAKWRAKINSPETKAKMSASRKASPKVLALFEDREFQARRSAAANSPEAQSKRLSTIQRKRRLAHNRRIAERWRFYVPPVLCHGCARLWMPAFGGRLGIWGPWPGFTVPKEQPPQQAAYTPEARARAWATRRVNEGWRQLASVRPDLFGSG